MTRSREYMRQNSLLVFYTVTFCISWGGMIIAIGGPARLLSSGDQSGRLMGVAFSLMAGPFISGPLMVALVSGKTGLRNLLSSLMRWRSAFRWYAVILLTAPLVMAVVFLSLSLWSPKFLFPIITADNKTSLFLTAVSAGLGGAFFEELGWTGFAVPTLRVRHGMFAAGLIAGVLWGAWHLLVNLWYGSSICDGMPLTLFLGLYFVTGVAQLTAYRVLMVWVYDRTRSLLMAILMHASLIVSTTPILIPAMKGADFLTWFVTSAVLMWVVVALVAWSNREVVAFKSSKQ